MESFFFFSFILPLPLTSPLCRARCASICRYTNDRGERGRGEKRTREREREEISKGIRRVPPLMNAATSGHHVFPSLVRPTTKHPPAHPSGRFSNPSPNRDWTLVHVGMRIRGIHFADRRRCTNARRERNIDNNYDDAGVCRITNRTPGGLLNVIHA